MLIRLSPTWFVNWIASKFLSKIGHMVMVPAKLAPLSKFIAECERGEKRRGARIDGATRLHAK